MVFNVSRSGYYAWLDSGLSFRSNENQRLTGQISKAHPDNKGTYGGLRIAREMNRQGIKVSRPRIERPMQKAKTRSIIKRKFRAIWVSDIEFRVHLLKIHWLPEV